MIKNFYIPELQSNGQWGSNFYPGPDVRKKRNWRLFLRTSGTRVRTKCGKAGETLGATGGREDEDQSLRAAWREHGWHAECQGGVETLQTSDVSIEKPYADKWAGGGEGLEANMHPDSLLCLTDCSWLKTSQGKWNVSLLQTASPP